MEHRDFIRAGLEYVCLIQEVQEKKKFEFVEIVRTFWISFTVYIRLDFRMVHLSCFLFLHCKFKEKHNIVNLI